MFLLLEKKILKSLSLKSTVMTVGGAVSAAENALEIRHTLYTTVISGL